MKRILLTGATGFLGHHVAQQLAERGDEVVALCRNPDASAGRRLPQAIQRVRGDVLDAESVRRAAEGCEILLHCAGRVSRDRKDAGLLHELNVTGTETALDAAREAGVRRAVVASTSGTVAVSRDPDRIIDEDAETPIELINRWPYYRAKLYAEQAALRRSGDGFEVISVNPTLLLGPGD